MRKESPTLDEDYFSAQPSTKPVKDAHKSIQSIHKVKAHTTVNSSLSGVLMSLSTNNGIEGGESI
jgi:hypothetical protein